MQKNRRISLLCVFFVILLLISSLSITSCATSVSELPPILQPSADEIDTALKAALTAKADSMAASADTYEASGEILKDKNGADIDMPSYIADLREDAQRLRTLTYDSYVLAIMDDLYARFYIDTYQSVLSAVPAMVDVLAAYAQLDLLTTADIVTEVLIECYAVALGDIYAGFVNTKTATEEKNSPNSYVGIGVTVTQRADGYIDILSVTPNSPAQEAGIAPGDVLTAVDGTDIATVDYNEVLTLVRGEEGTAVDLTLSRGGESYTVTVTRRRVQTVSVTYKLLSLGAKSTGYIRISEFSEGTFTEFVTAVTALEALGATEFVFDVRSNPGGNLDAVLGVLEYILPDDGSLPLIRMESKEEIESIYSVEEYLTSRGASDSLLKQYAPAKKHQLDARMAVLCDRYTASAGELFTSCLMDYGVAEVYGEVTYGKGLGQSSLRITDYHAYAELGIEYYSHFELGYFVIPTFYYSPPTSDNYHKIGVTPHHLVALSEEAGRYYVANIPEEEDDQLLAAVAFLQSDAGITGEENRPAPNDSLDVILWIVFGTLAAMAIALSAYLVVDYRRRAKRQASPSQPQETQEFDN